MDLPDLTGAWEHHLEWIQRFGLLRGEEALRTYGTWRVEVCGFRFHPGAVGADRDLVVDFYGWLILWDGQFDGLLGGAPEVAARVVDQVASVVRHTSSREGRGAGALLPAAKALDDVWRRESGGMSERWRERAAGNWTDYLAAHVAETVNRRDGVSLTLDDYLRLRDVAGAMHVVLDLAERLNHGALPDAVRDHPVMRELRQITVRVVDFVQDVLSLEKEVACGDPHNAVVVIEKERRWSRQQGVDEVRSRVQALTDRFLRLAVRLPAVCDSLDLSQGQRESTYRYVDAMRTCMRGNYDWCRTSSRYASGSVTAPRESRHVS